MPPIITINEDTQFPEVNVAGIPPDVRPILADIQERGIEAVAEYSLRFDGILPVSWEVPPAQFSAALERIPPAMRVALENAARRIRDFAMAQKAKLNDFSIQIEPGVWIGQKVIPLERAGVYVPGGNFPLVSSLLMGVIPSKTAGVKEVIVCTPPRRNGETDPMLLAAAAVAGADRFFLIGGVQAVGAMAYGSGPVPPVDKIVGPGNKYVTAAKKEVFGHVGIDFIAGPSEVLIIAAEPANPQIIAADMLAQSEHDEDASAILVTPSLPLAKQTLQELERQLSNPLLRTRNIALRSLEKNGKIYLVPDLNVACRLANHLAPEHLEIMTPEPQKWAALCRNFGSIFIGEYAAEVLGDYSSGLNHTLPTARAARYSGGLSVRDFLKVCTTLNANADGFSRIADDAVVLARFEGLDAHAEAIVTRSTQSFFTDLLQ